MIHPMLLQPGTYLLDPTLLVEDADEAEAVSAYLDEYLALMALIGEDARDWWAVRASRN